MNQKCIIKTIGGLNSHKKIEMPKSNFDDSRETISVNKPNANKLKYLNKR